MKEEWTTVSEPERGAVDELAFDAALAELERTVAELEAGGLALERTLALYERGVALQQRCERLLGRSGAARPASRRGRPRVACGGRAAG